MEMPSAINGERQSLEIRLSQKDDMGDFSVEFCIAF